MTKEIPGSAAPGQTVERRFVFNWPGLLASTTALPLIEVAPKIPVVARSIEQIGGPHAHQSAFESIIDQYPPLRTSFPLVTGECKWLNNWTF